MHDNSQFIALSLANSNGFSQICDFQFSQICDLAIWAADYYHKFVKKSLFVVCGCMHVFGQKHKFFGKFKSEFSHLLLNQNMLYATFLGPWFAIGTPKRKLQLK